MVSRSPAHRPTEFRELLTLSPADFESWCATLLEESGYGRAVVTRKGPKGGDGRVDLEILDAAGHVSCAVQCKRWKRRPASGLMRVIRELSGSMSRYRIGRGMLVITVPVTRFEKREAELLGIAVIDAAFLKRMLDGGEADPPRAVCVASTGSIGATEVTANRDGIYRIATWLLAMCAVVFAAAILYHYREIMLSVVGIGLLAVLGDAVPRRTRDRVRYRSRRRWRSRWRW